MGLRGLSFKASIERLEAILGDRNSLGRKLVVAVLGGAGVRFAGMVVTFLVGVQLARYLGPEGYGQYGTAMAIAAILIVFAQLGLPQLITREVSSSMARNDYSDTKGAIVWFTLSVGVASLVMMLVGFIGLRLWMRGVDVELNGGFFWALALVPLFALTNVLASVLLGSLRTVLAQIFEAVLRPLIFAFFLYCAFVTLRPMDVQMALMFHVVAAAIVLVLCVITLHYILPHQVRIASPALHARKWVSSAIPMTGTEIVRTIDGQYGVLMLGLIATVHDVGIFRVALATAGFLTIPRTVMIWVIMPYVAKFYAEHQTQKMQKLAAVTALVSFISTSMMTGILYFFGQELLKIVFGEPFVPAWTLLVLISLSFVIQSFFGSTATILNMSGEEKNVTIAYLSALIVAIFLSVVLIADYGVIGIAVAMIVAGLVREVIMWRRASLCLGIDTSLAGIIRIS